jgi:hypothetical protein
MKKKSVSTPHQACSFRRGSRERLFDALHRFERILHDLGALGRFRPSRPASLVLYRNLSLEERGLLSNVSGIAERLGRPPDACADRHAFFYSSLRNLCLNPPYSASVPYSFDPDVSGFQRGGNGGGGSGHANRGASSSGSANPWWRFRGRKRRRRRRRQRQRRQRLAEYAAGQAAHQVSSQLRSVASLYPAGACSPAGGGFDQCRPRWPAGREAGGWSGAADPRFDRSLAHPRCVVEPTLFTVFDLDCDADVILGFPWQRSHGLVFVYEDSQVCFCTEAGSPRASGYAWTWPRRRRRPRNLPLSLGGPPCCG